MNKFMHSIIYFFKEAFTIFRTNAISNVLSIVSLGLIFFLFAVLLMGRFIGNDIVGELSQQAEISVYYTENITEDQFQTLQNEAQSIDGVVQLNLVTSDEAYERMLSVLGEDATVLSYFDTSPFSPFLELEIDLSKIDSVVTQLNELESIDSIRDNFDILLNLKRFINLITIAFAFVSLAMATVTVIITSHIIRQGIFNNREQINTLRLLGAPTGFMITPYLIEGLFITMSGVLLAVLLDVQILKIIYGNFESPLPFITLPPQATLSAYSFSFLTGAGIILGLFGSIFGWVSVKE